MDIEQIKEYLKNYDGPDRNIMEVCGSHTEAVAKYGIPSLLSTKLHLLSGPGCPVCVTTSSYIDRLILLSKEPHTCVVTFGDLIRVPGSRMSLAQAKGEGARVEMVYSPMDVLELAKQEPETIFVFAAVGFETTTPVYAMLLEAIMEERAAGEEPDPVSACTSGGYGINSRPDFDRHEHVLIEEERAGGGAYGNIRLLTSIKTMPQVIRHLMKSGAPIDGFLAPGHVSVVTGSAVYEPIAREFQIPFGVSGFGPEELLVALYGIVQNFGQGVVKNYYPAVVTAEGNRKAAAMVDKYFRTADATWRGMGVVEGSGKLLREPYATFDAGSEGLDRDEKINPACCCDRVLMGRMKPSECPLFGKACNPMKPQGACMVSTEGSCFSYFVNKRTD